MIRIEGVSKFFDDKAAVDGVDLLVPEGSLFGLIGPNGAGKTTTLKMIATLMKPDTGRIMVGDLDLCHHVRRVRKILGYMPDTFGVFRGISCYEYLQFFGRSYDLYGRELSGRIEDVIALTDLTDLRDELTSVLSSGMRQRLSLAKTLLHDPSILLLDEPASGLDPRARIEIRSLLKELGKMGKTIVISSHILADLEEICTDVAILELGKMVWQGPLKSVIESDEGRKVVTLITVPEDAVERAVALIEALDFVTRARRNRDKIEAEILDAKSNDLLDALIQAGIEIRSFSQEKIDLEALFLERTKGIVS